MKSQKDSKIHKGRPHSHIWSGTYTLMSQIPPTNITNGYNEYLKKTYPELYKSLRHHSDLIVSPKSKIPVSKQMEAPPQQPHRDAQHSDIKRQKVSKRLWKEDAPKQKKAHRKYASPPAAKMPKSIDRASANDATQSHKDGSTNSTITTVPFLTPTDTNSSSYSPFKRAVQMQLKNPSPPSTPPDQVVFCDDMVIDLTTPKDAVKSCDVDDTMKHRQSQTAVCTTHVTSVQHLPVPPLPSHKRAANNAIATNTNPLTLVSHVRSVDADMAQSVYKQCIKSFNADFMIACQQYAVQQKATQSRLPAFVSDELRASLPIEMSQCASPSSAITADLPSVQPKPAPLLPKGTIAEDLSAAHYSYAHDLSHTHETSGFAEHSESVAHAPQPVTVVRPIPLRILPQFPPHPSIISDTVVRTLPPPAFDYNATAHFAAATQLHAPAGYVNMPQTTWIAPQLHNNFVYVPIVPYYPCNEYVGDGYHALPTPVQAPVPIAQSQSNYFSNSDIRAQVIPTENNSNQLLDDELIDVET